MKEMLMVMVGKEDNKGLGRARAKRGALPPNPAGSKHAKQFHHSLIMMGGAMLVAITSFYFF